jgi:nitrogen-specific signal transduction histidine kinase
MLVLGAALLLSTIAALLVVIGREVRRRRQTEAKLNETAALVEQAKRDFIDTVSHELRTPLTSIRGSLGLVTSGALGTAPEKMQAMLKIAHRNSERLVRIVNDILDIENIESGKFAIDLRDVPVAAFLRHALELNAVYAARHEVRFVLATVPDGTQVRADPDRLMQVMSKLLSNAAKFSSPGSFVWVRYQRVDTRVSVEVEDRGTGIPEGFRSRVFEKFSQADSSAARRFEGAGLGLSITRHLVQAMGGTIGFTSSIGRGTTFRFVLPAVATSLPLPDQSLSATARLRILTPTAQDPASVPRILHVEDDPDLSTVIQAALGTRAEVVSAASLRAAEDLLRREQFSLLILDPGLPDGNGLDLLDRLESPTAGPLPVLILSVTEVAQSVRQRVAATLVKSRVSESEIAATILSLTYARAAA